MNKFNVGDIVRNKFAPTYGGVITSILKRPGDPPAGWYPTAANNYTPPITHDIYLYKVDGVDIMMYEDTLVLDELYYKSLERDNKLSELGI